MSTRDRRWLGLVNYDSGGDELYFSLSFACWDNKHPRAERCRLWKGWQGPVSEAPRVPLWTGCRCTVERVARGSLLELARRERALRSEGAP